MSANADHLWPPIAQVDPSDDEAFHEWLLSDHPWAAAERQRRRSAYRARELSAADEVLAITSRLTSNPASPDNVRRVAEIVARVANEQAVRVGVDAVFDDETHVTQARHQLEIARHAVGEYHYRYPQRLTGPSAARQPPPGWSR